MTSRCAGVPNVSGQLERDVMTFYATTDLAVGDVLSWCYINLHQPKQANGVAFTRARLLQQSWGFGCCCMRCELDRAPSAAKSSRPVVADKHAAQLQRSRRSVAAFDTLHLCNACGSVKVPVHRQRNPARRRQPADCSAVDSVAAETAAEAAGGSSECACNTFNQLEATER